MGPNSNIPLNPNSYQQSAGLVPPDIKNLPSANTTGASNTMTDKRGNPNSTQNALQIAEIRDGIVIMKDGSFRSVVMVKAINFDLMSPEERESVEFSYQGFLNSLYFPIQIFIHSEKIDINPYMDMLQKIRNEQSNMLLSMRSEEHIQYMVGLAQQANIMDKKFYVVIAYFPNDGPEQAITQSKSFFTGLVDIFSSKSRQITINANDLNRAKDELRNRVQALLSGLAQANIQGLPLDTQELIELYYNTYNPDTSVRQQLTDFNQLNSPVITKGEGMAPQSHLNEGLMN